MPQKKILEGRGKTSMGEIPKIDKVFSESEEEKYSVGKIKFEVEACFSLLIGAWYNINVINILIAMVQMTTLSIVPGRILHIPSSYSKNKCKS